MTRLVEPSSKDDLYDVLARELLPEVKEALAVAGAGHCLRVTTLPLPVMDRLCEQLQEDHAHRVCVLGDGHGGPAWRVSSTKVIEYRNSLREPLLVFIPPNLRTAAEDSLDVATFTELALRNVSEDLRVALLGRLPEPLRDRVARALEYVRVERILWNADEATEFLLTIIKNGATAHAAGAALYCFGLVPDLEAFDHAEIEKRLSRNRTAARDLEESGAPILARIAKLGLKPDTIQQRLFVFLRSRDPDARSWGRDLVDEGWPELTFEKWQFQDAADDTSGVRIIVEDIGLPLQRPDEVTGAAQLPVLDLNETRGVIKVAFYSTPRPAEVPSWSHFRIQILASDAGGPTVAWESNSYPKPGGRRKLVRRSIKAKDLQSLDEGTYFVKVDAYDSNGNLLTTTRALDPDNDESRAENESDYFLVTRDEEVDEPESRAVFAASLTDAWASLATRALGSKTPSPPPAMAGLHGRWSEPLKAPTRGDVRFRLEGGEAGGQTIVVPGLFRKLEVEILANPEHLGFYRLNLAVPRLADVAVERRDQGLTIGAELDEFLHARRALFDAIHRQHAERAEAEDVAEHAGIVETADLLALESLVETYVTTYLDAAKSRDARMLAVLAQLDVVRIDWHPNPVDPGRALIVAPTHPVRIAWHFQHARQLARLVAVWDAKDEAAPDFRDLVSQYRHEVQPTHAPPVVFDSRGRGYVEQGPLTSHWSLYLPDQGGSDQVIDIAASRDRARASLGVRGSSSVLPSVGSRDLAVRLYEYLQLHPYVEQLHINVFNPGDAGLIADALRELDRKRRQLGGRSGTETPLRYVVRLFAPRDGVDLTGDALESLLDPDRQVGEDDEFTLASSNHLHPKLVFARNAIEDFLAHPADFTAHVSLMLEQFAVSARVGKVDNLRRGSFVAGLLQEPEIHADSWSGTFAWHKGLNPQPSPRGDEWEHRLVAAMTAGQRVQALSTLAEKDRDDVAPLLAMQLDSRGQALLKQVHVASDWVFTVDRNLGLEFYDSPMAAREAGYLLDFAPEYLQQDRLRLMLTTRSSHELEAIVRPAIEAYGLVLPDGGEVAALEALRSLSGRLALRFMASSTQSAEVVGLLLARWLLEQVGVLSGRIVIPLDAHRSWFNPGGDAVDQSRQRADLLLLSFEPKTKAVFGKIVEVKLREELPPAARSALYKKMREQSENTETRLRDLFDPERYSKPRADRLLRAKELSTALAFYVRRARRYGLLGPEETKASLDFVQDLDAGFRLDLSMVGVVFERASAGVHVDEDEPGYVVHRFGLDAANRLIAAACSRFDSVPASPEDSITEEPTRQSTVPPAPTSDEFDSFRDAIDRGSPSISQMVSSSRRGERGQARAGTVREGPTEPVSNADAQRKDAPAAPSVAEPEAMESESPQHTGAHSEPAPYDNLPAAATAPPPVAMVADSDVPPHPEVQQLNTSAVAADALVGSTEMTSQYGLLGKFGSAKVAVDLNGCNTISLFGVQGFGKSYTLGVIAEMATKAVPNINVLPSPLATVIFHYHKSDAYAPEYASAVRPNGKTREVELLREQYGAEPASLDDVVLLSPEARVEDRKREFPGMEVRPIKFSSGELGAEGWKFLLGAYGNDSLYIRQMVQIMRKHRGDLTLDTFKQEIAASQLPAGSRNLADMRITFAEPYIDDEAKLGELLRPGRTVIVDLRDEWIEKDEALGLFVVMLRIFAASQDAAGRDFNKLVVFDEAHKYITESDLIGQVVETIREMRHQATTVVIASQDPLSVPRAVVELTSILLLHRMTSPQWLKHLKSAISALDGISEGHLAALNPGEALLWAQRSTDARFMQRPQKITVRPRFTQHGGGTKTAVAGKTVR